MSYKTDSDPFIPKERNSRIIFWPQNELKVNIVSRTRTGILFRRWRAGMPFFIVTSIKINDQY